MTRTARWAILAPIIAVAALLAVPPGLASPSGLLGSPPPPEMALGSEWGQWDPIPYREPGLGLGVGPSTPTNGATELSVTLTLPFTRSAQLSTLLEGLDQPGSPTYRDYLSAAEFDAEFGGSPELYQAWSEYLLSEGATHITTYGDRATLTFDATPDVASAIFHTSIRSYHDSLGRPFYAPAAPPLVPGPLAAAGEYVDGLSSYSRYVIGTEAAGHPGLPELRPLVHSAASVNGYPAPVTVAGVQEQFTSDYQVAYDQLSLYQQFGYPTGAVAATILWSGNYSGSSVTTPYGTLTNNEAVGPFDPNDISAFYNETLPVGEPHPTVHATPLDGAPLPGPLASWDQTNAVFENTLDLEDLGALAPGASIYNVYAPWPSFAGLDQAFAYVLNPNSTMPGLQNVSVISNSWGATEINDTGWYNDLQEAQARGITVLAISGDSGDSPVTSWQPGDAFYPGSMAYDSFGDVAVGGTTNVLSATTLALLHQRVWYDATESGGPVGSTGGTSTLFPEPSWQASTSANGVIDGLGRGVPDVAAIANNSLMTFTYEGYQFQATNASVNPDYYYSWGTSIATPVEAGLLADVDYVLNRSGEGWLGFLDPTLYPLASEEDAPLVSNATVGFYYGPYYDSRLPTLPLTDVTVGANHVHAATTGYDLATGWGSIDAYNLTMFYLAPPAGRVPGHWSGVQAALNLSGLQVTSSYPGYGINTAYNASIQQNFFVANSLGAPIYWVQNVVYIYGAPGDWQMNFTGWLVYPFYGLEGSLTMYEYDAPITGVDEHPPVNFTFQTQILPGTGFNGQQIEFSFGTPGAAPLTLPAPGAAYIIGNLSYNYSWQGVEYSDGPYPAPYGGPGGLAPQFGLVGGPSGYIGNYGPETSGTAQLSFSFGGAYLAGLTQSFGESIDQTGEAASNLTWTETSAGNVSSNSPANWTFGYLDGAAEQGILESEPASLPPMVNVSVSETGVPEGSIWGINLRGAGRYTAVAPAGLSIPLPAGQYEYWGIPPAGYYAPGVAPGVGGWLVVNTTGQTLPLVLGFALYRYDVNVVESGLPAGTTWWFNSSVGTSGPLTAPAGFGLQAANGTYPFNASAGGGWSVRPADSLLVVDGQPVNLTVEFSPVSRYEVTFESTGLPDTDAWSVTLGNVTRTATTSAAPIGFYLQNGTYGWSAATDDLDYRSEASPGTVTVNGSAVIRGVTFSMIVVPAELYNVTFEARGLPSGNLWYIEVNGLQYPEVNATEATVVALPNGTSFYSATSADPAYGEVGGEVNVSGAPRTVHLPFAEVMFLVTISVTGLPNGSTWYVSVADSPFEALPPYASASFLLSNGSYPFYVAVPSGYNATPANGTITVDGRSQSLVVKVTPLSPGPLGTPLWETALAAGIAVAAIALLAIAAIVFRRRTRRPPAETSPVDGDGAGPPPPGAH